MSPLETENCTVSPPPARGLPSLLFLPLLLLPLVHIPSGMRTLEALSIKMYFVLPASAIALFYVKRKYVRIDLFFLFSIFIVSLNLVSFLLSGREAHPLQVLLTLVGFTIFFQGSYRTTHAQKDILLFLKISIGIAAAVGGYSVLQQIRIDPLGLRTWDSISATFPNRNFLAGYMAFSLLTVLFFLLKTEKKSPFLFLSAVSIGDGLVLSQTRGAWLAFLAGITVAALLDIFFLYENQSWKKNYLKKLPVFCAIFAFVVGTTWAVNSKTIDPLNINERLSFMSDIKEMITTQEMTPLQTTTSHSVKMRYLYWRMAYDMIVEHPFLGKGLGQFREEYLSYLKPYLNRNEYKQADTRIPIGVDNDYLEFWVESGLFNLIAYLFFLGFTFLRVYSFFKNTDYSSSQKTNMIMLTGSVIVIVSHGFFHYSLHDPTMGSLFWVFMGLINAGVEGRIEG